MRGVEGMRGMIDRLKRALIITIPAAADGGGGEDGGCPERVDPRGEGVGEPATALTEALAHVRGEAGRLAGRSRPVRRRRRDPTRSRVRRNPTPQLN